MISRLTKLPAPLWFLFAGTTITRLGSFVFPFLTIYLSEARSFSADRVGLILSVGSLGLLSGNLLGGWLADGWSRKRTLLLALLLNAAGFFGLSGHFESGVGYAAFLFLGYLGSGMYTPAANTVVADLTSSEIRPFAYTVNYVCINLGMALGPLMGGLLAGFSYRLIFLGDVATTLVCLVLILLGVAETRRRVASPVANNSPRVPILETLRRHRLVTAFCLVSFFLIAPLMGLEYCVPLLVKTVYDAELTWVGVVYTINAACILSFSFLIERLVRRRNDLMMMTLAGLLWTAGLLLLNLGHSLVALLACTAVWTFGEMVASIVGPTFISRRVAPEYKGRFLALNDAMRSLAGVVAPIALGWVWEHQGVPLVLLIVLILPMIGTVCYGGMLFLGSFRSSREGERGSRNVAEAHGR